MANDPKNEAPSENLFHRRARLKAEAENITFEEALKILHEEVAAMHRGDYSPEREREKRAARHANNNQQIVEELNSCKTKLDVLNVINKYYSFVIDGGKSKVYREVNKDIQSLDISAFKDWCANKSVPVTTTDPDGKTETTHIKLFDFWWKHVGRLEYAYVDFDPSKTFDRNDRSNDTYNMWRGWETIGKKPETLEEKLAVKDLLRFIYEIICNRNRKHFFWTLSWIADLIQNPADPKGVALVLIGSKGIGKTFFGELICSLVGDKYSFITANKKDIFGDFDGHLSNLMFCVLEEAVWAENHQIEAILKVFITGKRRSSKAKYHDTKMINNYIRSLILANPGWAVPASMDERRYTILNPSEERMKDLVYFGDLRKKFDNGGKEALMYFFEHYRIGRGKVDIRSALKTEGLLNQQEESLEPFESWLLEEFLYTGVVRCCANGTAGMKINRTELYRQYIDWYKQVNARGKILNSRKFGIKFGSYFPKYDPKGNIQKTKMGRIISIFTKNDTTNTDGHIYAFPLLKDTRELVFKRIGRVDDSYWEGGSIDWVTHPDSAHLPKGGATPDHVDMKIDDEGNVIIPFHPKK
jgi:hypothetical protein